MSTCEHNLYGSGKRCREHSMNKPSAGALRAAKALAETGYKHPGNVARIIETESGLAAAREALKEARQALADIINAEDNGEGYRGEEIYKLFNPIANQTAEALARIEGTDDA